MHVRLDAGDSGPREPLSTTGSPDPKPTEVIENFKAPQDGQPRDLSFLHYLWELYKLNIAEGSVPDAAVGGQSQKTLRRGVRANKGRP